MKQLELYEKALREQEERIKEMEKIISLLKEENSLQRQLIEKLQEENRILNKYMDDYLGAVDQMLNDFDPE